MNSIKAEQELKTSSSEEHPDSGMKNSTASEEPKPSKTDLEFQKKEEELEEA